MAGAPQQGGGQSDNSAGILWGVAAIFAGIAAVWYAFRHQIIHLFLSIKLSEVYFLSYLSSHFHFLNQASLNQLSSTIIYARANSALVSFNDLLTIGTGVGVWFRIPFALILIILAFIVYTSSSTRIFKRTYSMQDLAKSETVNWPQILPVANLDLVNTDLDTGPWAMAMTPMQFCKRYRLLEEVRPQRYEGMSRREWDRVDVVLKRGETNKLFALQLGQLWKGVDRLPPYTKALFAVFAARINEGSDEAAKLLTQLSLSAANKKLNMSGVDALLKKYENTKGVQRIVQNHAYVATVMASMLEGARVDGVQASADFLWLKPVDRRLWYTLNTVGRQTPFIEVAGIFAHWGAEKEAARKLLVPMVEEATRAVESALKDVVYRPDEV